MRSVGPQSPAPLTVLSPSAGSVRHRCSDLGLWLGAPWSLRLTVLCGTARLVYRCHVTCECGLTYRRCTGSMQ